MKSGVTLGLIYGMSFGCSFRQDMPLPISLVLTYYYVQRLYAMDATGVRL